MRLLWIHLVGAALVVPPLAACGKRGPPLAPLLRVPAQVAELTAARSADDVFLTLRVPAINVGGDTPGDVGAVEIYAATAERAPELDERLPAAPWVPLTRLPVRRPVPPPPPSPSAAPSTPPVPPPPVEPGLDQGQQVTVRERLTPEVLVAPAAAPPVPRAAEPGEAPPLSLPLTASTVDRTARRFYAARAVTRGGRPGQWSAVRSVPLASPLEAPQVATPTYDATSIALSWTPPAGAPVAVPPPAEGLLPARPFGPALPATRYNIYAAEAVTAEGAFGVVVRPAPLNPSPLATTVVSTPGIVFGQQRCFVVRSLTELAGAPIEGPPSAPSCVTPVDTFPPPPPSALEAVGGAGVISLIWEAAEVPDLAGYLVLRGDAPGDPATLLTPAPIRDTSFEDRSVRPGVRYVYAVVAVDSATPANRSGPSNRAEETARQ
jgi:hypothetical protein